MNASDSRPLIVHIVFRFDIGGLENGVVNLINGLPDREFRHAVIALTEATDFARRVQRRDVTVHAIGKRPGKDPRAYLRLFRLLRTLRPDIVHTRNLGTIECAAVAALAGVRRRIHGEHGWDVHDPDGKVFKYKLLRRLLNVFIHEFVTVSRDLAHWLIGTVGIRATKVRRICNGVDTQRFHPDGGAAAQGQARVVVGSVLRFEPIKDPLNLVQAFLAARRRLATAGVNLSLLMVGDGPLRSEALALLQQDAPDADLPGAREDQPEWFRKMDIYVLGSRREGISNTLLEAMASGLPLVATATGGNLELVVDGVTGQLVPPGDSAALAQAIVAYALDPDLRRRHGAAARQRAESEYSLRRMLEDYRRLYAAGHQPVAA